MSRSAVRMTSQGPTNGSEIMWRVNGKIMIRIVDETSLQLRDNVYAKRKAMERDYNTKGKKDIKLSSIVISL